MSSAESVWQTLQTPDGRTYHVNEAGFGLTLVFADADDDVDFEIQDEAYYTRPGDFDPATFDFATLNDGASE